MDKKFLSAEEAVSLYGIDPAEFQRLVDEGELRSLADRGTWRYRRDEIEQLIGSGRLSAAYPAGDAPGSMAPTLEFDSPRDEGGPEDLAFLELDEQALEEGATMVKPTIDFPSSDENALMSDEPGSGFRSDSEILKIEDDDESPAGSTPRTPSGEIPVAGSLSELDIVISSDSGKAASDSGMTGESSVIVGVDADDLVESDSDVKVVSSDGDQSGSSVTGKTDHVIIGEDNVIAPAGDTSGIVASDSDVRLADSGISLEQVDSGITLESSAILVGDSSIRGDDSGISLEADSGLTLDANDSGIQLEPADSGIMLEAGDSGISLEDADDSGIAVSGQKPSGRAPRPDDTQAEFDEVQDEELLNTGDQTAMIAIDEDDASSRETLPPTKAKKGKSPALSDSFDNVDEVEDLEIMEDLDAGELDVDAVEYEDEEEAVEDILEASDEAFSMSDVGELSEASMSSIPVMKPVVAKEPSWGIVAIFPIAACALLLLVQGLLLWDGINTMWTGDTSKAVGVSIIDALGG